MAEVQHRHRKAAWDWQESKGISHEKCADTLCAFCLADGRDRDIYAQALANQEDEIASEATRLGRMLTDGKPPGGDWKESDKAAMYAAGKRLLEFGGNVRSGEWRPGGRTPCKACGRRSCMCQ